MRSENVTGRPHGSYTKPEQKQDNAKRLATLTAELALRGFVLRECETGGFFVSRWNLTKFCRDQSDVEDFAQTVGVKP